MEMTGDDDDDDKLEFNASISASEQSTQTSLLVHSPIQLFISKASHITQIPESHCKFSHVHQWSSFSTLQVAAQNQLEAFEIVVGVVHCQVVDSVGRRIEEMNFSLFVKVLLFDDSRRKFTTNCSTFSFSFAR